MEPEGSLPCSQEPFTGPYPKLDQSNPYHPILSIHLYIHSPIRLHGIVLNKLSIGTTLSLMFSD
jgi:hypothetical protein